MHRLKMARLVILISHLLFPFLIYGQSNSLEGVEFQTLSPSDRLAKCIFLANEVSVDERKAHEMIWGLKSVRDLAERLLEVGTYMETLTVTLERPSDRNLPFIIALYNRQPKIINSLMIYRVDLTSKRIERRYDPESEWTMVRE